MEISELLGKVIAVVTGNKLEVNKDFNTAYIERNDFFPEAQTVAEYALRKMSDYCTIGVNSGFSKDIRAAIAELSDIVVKLTEVKSNKVQKINKLKEKVDNVKISARKEGQQVNYDPRDDIRSYITTTIGAIDAIVEHQAMFGESVAVQRANLDALRAKLVDMLVKLNNVRNITSKEAAHKAIAIVEELLYVRDQISGLYCTREVLARVDGALRVLDQWVAMAVATDKRNAARKEDFPPEYVEDNITTLSNASQSLSDFELFRIRFNELEQRVLQPQVVVGWRNRLEQVNSEMDNLQKDIDALMIEVENNGETASAERRAQEMLYKQEQLEREKTRLENQIENYHQQNMAQMKILETFKTEVYDQLMMEKDTNPIQLCVMVEYLDLGSILRVLMSGNFSQKDLDAATKALIAAQTQARIQSEALKGAIARFNQVKELQQERQREQMRQDSVLFEETNRQQQPKQKQPSAIERLRQKQGIASNGNGGNVQQNNSQQTEKNTTTIPLKKDDN